MAKQLQSTFEFTGNVVSDGEHTYNQFTQIDNKGREISMAANNVQYIHNVTLNEQVVPDDSTVLNFRADYEAGDYSFQTKLKDGRILHGTVTQVAVPAQEVEEQPEQDEPKEEIEGESQQETSDEDPAPESADEAGDQDEPKEDDMHQSPLEQEYNQRIISDEGNVIPLTEDQDEKSVQGQEGESNQSKPYYVHVNGVPHFPEQESVQDVFDYAQQELRYSDTVDIYEGDNLIATLGREKRDDQYVTVSTFSANSMSSEESEAMLKVCRRIVTGMF